MTNKKLKSKALLGVAGLALASTLQGQTLLQDKDFLGYEDVAYNAADNTNTSYLVLDGNVIKQAFSLNDATHPATHDLSGYSPVALFDANVQLESSGTDLGMYVLENDGNILFVNRTDNTINPTSISLSPGAGSFTGGASNQNASSIAGFLAVGNNNTFAAYDASGAAKWKYDHSSDASGRKIIDLEGSLSDTGFFTGVFKYEDLDNSFANDFEEVTNLELTAVPEPSYLGLGALALGLAATRRRPRQNLEYNLEK